MFHTRAAPGNSLLLLGVEGGSVQRPPCTASSDYSCCNDAGRLCCLPQDLEIGYTGMYFVSIVLLLFVFPAGCVVAEAVWLHDSTNLAVLASKWFVFWAVGVRLFIAGIRQVLQPQFTAERIFDIKDHAAAAIVREIGFGNLSMGALGLASLFKSGWVVPAAIVGGLYYGLAGAGHLTRNNRNFNEQVALISDLLMFVLLGTFVVISGF
jgi:hypothetical protein